MRLTVLLCKPVSTSPRKIGIEKLCGLRVMGKWVPNRYSCVWEMNPTISSREGKHRCTCRVNVSLDRGHGRKEKPSIIQRNAKGLR